MPVQNIDFGLRRLDRLEQAHVDACARLASLRAPHIVGEADGEDIRALSDFLIAVADAIDPLIERVGQEAKSNATIAVDLSVFRRVLFGAIDGNATNVLHEIANRLDEDQSAALDMRVGS